MQGTSPNFPRKNLQINSKIYVLKLKIKLLTVFRVCKTIAREMT